MLINFNPAIRAVQLERVVEETLGDETARNSGLVTTKRLPRLTGVLYAVHVELLLGPKLAHIDDGLAILEVDGLLVLAEELRVVAGLHVTSVVLVEVIQLIVDIDGLLDDATGLYAAIN